MVFFYLKKLCIGILLKNFNYKCNKKIIDSELYSLFVVYHIYKIIWIKIMHGILISKLSLLNRSLIILALSFSTAKYNAVISLYVIISFKFMI